MTTTMTATGWPKNKTIHNLPSILCTSSDKQYLCDKFKLRFGIELLARDTFTRRVWALQIDAKIGINKYAEMHAWLEGFKAGLSR